MIRRTACLGFLGVLVATGAAQPPAPRGELPPPLRVDGEPRRLGEPPSPALQQAVDALRAEREVLEKQRRALEREMATRPDIDETARLKLRLQIADLLRRLAEKHRPPPTDPAVTPPLTRVPDPPRPIPTPGDPLLLGQTQFRARQFEAALATLRGINLDTLSPRDRAWARYLMASCLRQLGKLSEAAVVYREVANAGEDPFLTETAVWQLGVIKWRQDTQEQLDALRRKTP